MRRKVDVYVAGVVVAAAVAAAAVYLRTPVPPAMNVQAAIVFSVLGLVAELLAFQIPRASVASTIAFIPFIAAVLVAADWTPLAGLIGAQIICACVARRAAIKSIFNIAQSALALALAALVYEAIGGRPMLAIGGPTVVQLTPAVAVLAVATIVVYLTANSFLVSGVLAITEGRSFFATWCQLKMRGGLVDVLAMPVVLVLSWTYLQFGPVWTVAAAAPLLGIRQLYVINLQLATVNHELLDLMVKSIEARDPYTSGHSRRVSQYARIIARAIGMSNRAVERVATAALLHDVGKIHECFAPMLRKPARLSPEEWTLMQTHAVKSAELVGTVSHLRDLAEAVRHHHENWDGSGYPDGLAGEAIPVESRVIIFADMIDAMTTDRPYRSALGESEVRAEITRCRGRQFDPRICDRLLTSPAFSLLFSSLQAESTPALATLEAVASHPRVAVLAG